MKDYFECLNNPGGACRFFEVPDQTLVNPFLNPNDAMSSLPPGLVDGLAIAAGQVNAGVVSNIVTAPHILEVTLLLSGRLRLNIKDPENPERYHIDMVIPEDRGGPGFTFSAHLLRPGTFFQLDNSAGTEPARVLYISTPSYVFEPGPTLDDPPVYDDAIQLGRDWEALEQCNWQPPELMDPSRSLEARTESLKRLSRRQGT